MRILLIALPLVVLGSSVGAQDLPSRVVPAFCKQGADKTRATELQRPRKLGELPPAKEYKTVWRTDARGCPQPIVGREGIGGTQR